MKNKLLAFSAALLLASTAAHAQAQKDLYASGVQNAWGKYFTPGTRDINKGGTTGINWGSGIEHRGNDNVISVGASWIASLVWSAGSRLTEWWGSNYGGLTEHTHGTQVQSR